MTIRKNIASGTLACIIAASSYVIATPAHASDAGAFIGGVLATKVVSNMSRRTEAEEAQAAAAQQPRSAPADSSSSSPEQRIKQLDKLAAGGYITPAEYKQKKKAILDSM